MSLYFNFAQIIRVSDRFRYRCKRQWNLSIRQLMASEWTELIIIAVLLLIILLIILLLAMLKRVQNQECCK